MPMLGAVVPLSSELPFQIVPSHEDMFENLRYRLYLSKYSDISVETEKLTLLWCSYCDNETVDGVEYPSFPKSLEPQEGQDERLIVADMSSNFLSRRVPISNFAVIFGGAQKNIGITDVTLAIVRKDLLATVPSPSFLHKAGVWSPPSILNWVTISQSSTYISESAFLQGFCGEQQFYSAQDLIDSFSLQPSRSGLCKRKADSKPAIRLVI